MMKYDKNLWHGAELINTKYELYFDPDKSPWGNSNGFFSQHDDFEPGKGLPVFVKDFELDKLKNIKLIFTSLGCVDIFINGKRVGNDELKPGWSSYEKRTLYYEYDVTEYAVSGKNRILAVLSNGWYSGRIVGNFYGSHYPAFMACISADGSVVTKTDSTWRADVCGQILSADIWDGEFRDSRKQSYAEMSTVDFSVDNWKFACVADYFDGEVTKFIGPTVQVRPELSRKAVSYTVYDGIKENGSDFGEINIIKTSENIPLAISKKQKVIVDLGQELVGWAKIGVKAAAGTTVKMRYSEMLNDSGSLERGNDGPKGGVYTVNLRTAKAKAYYVTSGKEEESYYPTFTFFGFRYVEISADGDFELCSFVAEVVGSTTREIGHIETSSKLINKLISNIRWGQRSNYLFVPTDCPQRDERLGWTGDTQAFSVTAAYNADVLGFFHKWLQDMRDSQSEEGAYSDVVPRVKCANDDNASAWGDAGIIVPYNMYKIYGDKTIITEHYASMEKYIAQLVEFRGMTGPIPRYGDWLSYDYCRNEFISAAYFIHDLDIMAEMSDAISKPDRAEHYRKIREKAQKYFELLFMKDGKLCGNTQTDYVISLAFNLIKGDYAKQAANELVEKIKENGNKLSTGFLGTYNLCTTLSKVGKDNTAYNLLLQRNEPSWLYSVDQGATTIWERWNSYTIEKGFGDVGMNSFNHYAYGAVQEWMYRYMAGIESDAAGFEKLLLQPRIDTRTDEEIPDGEEKITWVKASYDSVKGLIESSWNTENGFVYECTVPNVKATLMLPILGDSLFINGEAHDFNEFECYENCAVISLARGHYVFVEK